MQASDIGALVWLGVLFAGECVAYELRDWLNRYDDTRYFSVAIFMVFWPLALPLALAAGALWLASWTVRGPMRFASWLVFWLQTRSAERQLQRFERDVLERSKLPKAQVRR